MAAATSVSERVRRLEQVHGVRPVLSVVIVVLLLGGVLAAGGTGDDADPSRLSVGPEGTTEDSSLTPEGVQEGATTASSLPLTESRPGQRVTTGGATGTGGTGSNAGTSGGTGTQAGGGGGTAARLPVGRGVKGVTDTKIKLGMVTTDAKATGSVVGGATGSNVSLNFDYDKLNEAAVAAVNERGGIAGRTVETVDYFYNTANFVTASGRQQENQRACAHWTEDNQVFAFSGSVGTEEIMAECAARTKTPWIVTGYHLFISQRRFAAMSDYYYNPPSFVADRRERGFGRFLVGHNLLGANTKVALMIEDRPDVREGVAKGMKPALASAGITPALEIVYPDMVQSPWSTYVVNLRNAGVTHVVWSAQSGRAFQALLMLRAAEDQEYRPKWLMASDIGPGYLSALDAPKRQLANVEGMGWHPDHDMADPAFQSETAKLCGAAMAKKGQPPGNAWGQSQCDFLFFLKAAFERADQLSATGLAAGVAKLGDSFGSTKTIGGATRFGPGRHDGATVVRRFAFDAGANQFRYTSPPQPVPD